MTTVERVLVDAGGQREFRLLRRLGEGGFGEVYLARLRSAGGLDQRVAVKLLRPDVDKRSLAVERLRDEAAVLASLHHPVILVAHDLVQLQDRIALVTEYVEGQDLRECITDPVAPIPLSALLDVVGQVAGALDAAWTTARIVHRDVKPENIRIGRHGNVKLLDFGIAKSAEATGPARTRANALIGSVLYLAPERFDRSRALTPASDLFALGCVLFEGIARCPLFEGLDLAQMFGLMATPGAYEAHLEHRLAAIDDPAVRDLLHRMVDREPEARITAGEVPAVCDAVLATLPGHPTLRTWCRARIWPQVPDDDLSSSPLPAFGRPPAEPTSGFGDAATPAPVERPLATLEAMVEARTAPRARRRWVGLAAAVLALGGLSVVGVIGISALGLVLAAGTTAEPPEVVAPIEVPDPPVEAPPVVPVPVAPVPVVAAPVPVVAAPRVAEVPVIPAPVVVPEPASVSAKGPLELRSGDRVYQAGEPTPPGTYTMYADFGRGFEPAGTITLAAGQAAAVSCNSILQVCTEGSAP